MDDWIEQLKNWVNNLSTLSQYIQVTEAEKQAILELKTRWGTTPYFASLMDPNNPKCPIRKQVVPSLLEKQNVQGMSHYLMWKERREDDIDRPDCIARQYYDRVAFTVTDQCATYCRHCFRKEVTVNQDLRLHFDIKAGLEWIGRHSEIRDVLITGGDPFLFSDEKIEFLILKLREIKHVRMIRFGTRTLINLPQRITSKLLKILSGFHRVPLWINTQCNHPREITDKTAQTVYRLLTAGVNIGNQAVLLKGINDDSYTFRALHHKLLQVRIRPYYLHHCEPAPGIDHFRTSVQKGEELIRNTLCGHTTGMARPLYVIATKAGKKPACSESYVDTRTDHAYQLPRECETKSLLTVS